ncbi:redoxin domain-containing protein [Candidatus Poribacteria bacterium]|nr:redoxin domain-containing protein [Candidatus Poribacteria bacterium]MYB01377.1 redoxin domain-containing protein [Candidatus Poribacteria bacterium]
MGKSLKQDSVDAWDAYLSTLERNGLADPHWEVESEVQEKLIDYFKAKIDAGVSDGLTSLPERLPSYVHRFPEEMLRAIKSHAENVLAADPNNGAAAKFLAIEAFHKVNTRISSEKYPLLEKTMVLAPNDIEICFFAYAACTRLGDQMQEEALVALERMLERLRGGNHKVSYLWTMRLYTTEVDATPVQNYLRINKRHPVVNRWEAVLNAILVVFENELLQTPDSGVFNIIAHIHEAMGDIEAAQAVFQKIQPYYEERLKQNPNDRTALSSLANIHGKLGNSDLAREYRVKTDPTLAWEGQVLPEFSPVVDLDGKPVWLADYRGKLVLLDFWATWCGPCIAELPNIKEVYEEYHNRGFEVIGISLDSDETALRKFIKENQLPWRQVFDEKGWENPLVKKYGVRGIPAQFLIDREGRVISVKARGKRLADLIEAEIGDNTD